MSYFSALGALKVLVDQSYTTPSKDGLSLTFSHFDGYSPMLDGAIRTVFVESAKEISVKFLVEASREDLCDNIRIRQNGNDFAVGTGGLSFMGSIATRMNIEILITLPKECGNLTINALKLPIVMQSAGKCKDVVLTSESSEIDVGNIDCWTLSVTSRSGAIIFPEATEQYAERFVKVTCTSGEIKLLSSIFTPDLQIESTSGSVKLLSATNAKKLKLSNKSGSVNADLDFMDSGTSDTTYESASGSLNVKLRRWSGYITAQSGSGSKKIVGRGLKQINGGWQNGDGASTAHFTTKSGSIRVEIL